MPTISGQAKINWPQDEVRDQEVYRQLMIKSLGNLCIFHDVEEKEIKKVINSAFAEKKKAYVKNTIDVRCMHFLRDLTGWDEMALHVVIIS